MDSAIIALIAELDPIHALIALGFIAYIHRERIKSALPKRRNGNGNHPAMIKASAVEENLSKHERECEKRHERIHNTFGEIRADIAGVKEDVGDVKSGLARVEGYLKGKEV